MSKKAPVPLTYAEEQAQEMADSHVNRVSMNDAHSSMGGVTFSLAAPSEQIVKDFANCKINYVMFVSNYFLELSLNI